MSINQYKTNNRTKIMEYLMENRDMSVSVRDIGEYMDSENNPVNITTIYRYLDKLEKEGNIIKYAGETGEKSTYQYVDREHKCDEHLHLKCVRCGAIIHLDCTFMDEISNHILNDHNFKLQCKNSVIYGVCSKCQKSERKSGEQ